MWDFKNLIQKVILSCIILILGKEIIILNEEFILILSCLTFVFFFVRYVSSLIYESLNQRTIETISMLTDLFQQKKMKLTTILSDYQSLKESKLLMYQILTLLFLIDIKTEERLLFFYKGKNLIFSNWINIKKINNNFIFLILLKNYLINNLTIRQMFLTSFWEVYFDFCFVFGFEKLNQNSDKFVNIQETINRLK